MQHPHATWVSVLAVSAVIGTWILTGLVRRLLLARQVVDIPNERSSHSVPTPRGGGLALAVVVLLGMTAAGVQDLISPALALAAVGGGCIVAGAGLADDWRGLSPLVRLLAQGVAASWAVWCLGDIGGAEAGWLAAFPTAAPGALAVLLVIWMTNLYNFMDGIDGIAGVQAVIGGGGAAALLILLGAGHLALLPLLLLGSSLGFLPWNWTPARIFMGDVGSGFLGFQFGLIAVAGSIVGGVPAVLWFVLFGVFVFDATVTLLRRALRGEQWYSAHRKHAYQRLVQSGWSHARVTWAAGVIMVAVAGLALIGGLRSGWLPGVTAVAFAMLSGAYLLVERRQPMFPRDGSDHSLGTGSERSNRTVFASPDPR